MKYYIKYETTESDRNNWQTMPYKVPIEASTESVARVKFWSMFEKCFGDTLKFRILGIDTSK